jgi:hypothetical protein
MRAAPVMSNQSPTSTPSARAVTSGQTRTATPNTTDVMPSSRTSQNGYGSPASSASS